MVKIFMRSQGIVNQGVPFDVTVLSSGPESITGAQVNLSFNPTELSLAGADFSTSAFPQQFNHVVSPGLIKMGRTRLGGGLPLTGENLFCVLSFLPSESGLLKIHVDTTSQISAVGGVNATGRLIDRYVVCDRAEKAEMDAIINALELAVGELAT